VRNLCSHRKSEPEKVWEVIGTH